MSPPGFETQWSETETETRLWSYETETSKVVSRDMSRGIPLIYREKSKTCGVTPDTLMH